MESNFETEYLNTEDKEDNGHALNLKFTIGYSSNMIGAIHNLTVENKKEIFFPSAHTGVIYNYETGEQKLLQGHCNLITACCSAYDPETQRRYIVTADTGKNAMVVLWNADTGCPEKTIFKIPENPVVSIDISKNCTFLAMLSSQMKNGVVVSQKVTIWELRNKTEQIFEGEFEEKDQEVFELLRFNPNKDDGEIELLINGKSKISFWNISTSDPETCRTYYPIKSKGSDKKDEGNTKNSKQKAISYTQSTFFNNSSMAITATTAGYVIVWDICEALCKEDEVKTDRRKIKTVQLLKHKKDMISDKDIITFLLNYEENIVIGSGDGAVRFYDVNFIIVRWFENVCWMVTSISFDMSVGYHQSKDISSYHMMEDKPNEESGNTNKFKCIPFITSDISATINRVYNSVSAEIDYNDDNVRYQEIYRGVESNITSIALHPKRQILAFGADSKSVFKKKKDPKQKESIIREKKFEFKPYIHLFYYPDHMKVIKEEIKRREEEQTRKKQENENMGKGKDNSRIKIDDEKYINPFKRYFEAIPTVLEYSADGKFLMVGTDDEKIYILSEDNIHSGPILQIKDVTEQNSKAAIHEIIFAGDEKHFAASDTFGRIGLFKNENPYSNNLSDKMEWTLLARHHFKHNNNGVTSFCFSEKSNRLYTICHDRYLYEFEVLQNSNYENYSLTIKSKIKVEYDCNMTSLVCYPPVGTGRDRNLIISNDEFKLRTIMVYPVPEPLVRQTSLGPCYGGPIKKLRVIPGNDKDKRLLAFSTEKKVFGLIYLPIDGNPFRYMGVIGHPNTIQDIKPTKNLDYILTTGGTDFTINGWRYNVNPLNDAVLNNGSDLKPFLTLLEGGEDGLKFQDMKNFFYYAQIKSKDENTTKMRTLSEIVPKEYIHGLLTSMDFYPSKKELQNIENEVRYSKYSENEGKNLQEGLTFEMFVKIYLNHKPYRELEMTKIENSFENIKSYLSKINEKSVSEKGISRDAFLQLLKDEGEEMKDEELNEILRVLKGDSNQKNLNDPFTFQYLFEELLNFETDKKEEENNNLNK